MLMLIYVLFAWIAAPVAFQLINRQATMDGRLKDAISGWPSWAINAIICVAIAFITMVLPGGWKFSLWNLFTLTAIIHFGNQAFYNSVIRPFAKRRAALNLNPLKWS